MGLQEYIKKRKFDKTPEPKGETSQENQYRFVVQRHQASRLHYDLRLEIDGVLKSWAVPKGPSLNIDDKRLAIQTEDHPVKYLDFEGTIPKGNYGAGEMQIWDSGIFEIVKDEKENSEKVQFENGDLKLLFFGNKIKGNFALVKMKGSKEENLWLLIKKKDNFSTDLDYDAEVFISRPNKSNNTSLKKLKPHQLIKPMLASPAKKIFNDPNWIFELKWDGYRVISHVENGIASLNSRNGISYDQKFKNIKVELERIPHDVILDGEIVIVDKDGFPDFQKLQNYNPKETLGILRYYVFDILYLNGHETLELTLLERKSLIPEVLEGLEHVLYCDHIEDMGITFYNRAVDSGLEGVIAKKKESKYALGTRSPNWLKIKSVETEEAIICGYTESETGGALFGSLILGIYQDGILNYVGNCGSGFSNANQRELLKVFKNYKIEKSPFKKKINLKGRIANWMLPELVCEVKFSEWTKNGIMRHPVFKAMRNDKIPQEITPQNIPKKKNTKAVNSSSSSLEIEGISVPVSNIEKIYWPDSGLRKYDLIDYYLKVSEVMLPYLIDRPQNLHRHPNGITSDGFYQKDNENLPSWVETTAIYSKSSNKNIDYLLCQNEATLIYMANLGCIEINPWNSKVGQFDMPDYTVIDLDPSQTNTFEEVIETAQVVKDILDLAGISGYCKTSGSTGLHVYIPLDAQYSYADARDFAKLLCYYVHERLPNLTSMERAVKNRKGKIYLDYLQNRKGQTLAAPYCVRPKKEAPVSAPLEWEEVKIGLKIREFTLQTMPQRLTDIGDIFQPVIKTGINMANALEKLNSQ